jgi:hypothetical protein
MDGARQAFCSTRKTVVTDHATYDCFAPYRSFSYSGLKTCRRMNATMSAGRSTRARPESNTSFATRASV